MKHLVAFTISVSSLPCLCSGFVREASFYRHGQQRIPTFTPSGYCSAGGSPPTIKVAIFAAGTDSDATSPTVATADEQTQAQKAPVLNGKRVLPFQIMTPGLQGHKVFAVYAVLNAKYPRGTEGWESCEYVGVTDDLDSSLKALREMHGESKVAHVRALSFTFPQEKAMQDVARDWRGYVAQAGGSLSPWTDDDNDPVMRAVQRAVLDDDEEEDDDDEDDWTMEMTAQAMSMARTVTAPPTPPLEPSVVSPFASTEPTDNMSAATSSGELTFTQENVNQVLDEVRPYLIADGGNVSVERVDAEKFDVYLKLQGACGSCPSSTVTMQMGIERLLKEKFPNLGQVLQVQDGDDGMSTPAGGATELTWEAVQNEVNRVKPAITALGGIVEIVKVDPIGVVDLKFRGSNRIRQGLEMAVRDVPFVKHVNFVMGDE